MQVPGSIGGVEAFSCAKNVTRNQRVSCLGVHDVVQEIPEFCCISLVNHDELHEALFTVIEKPDVDVDSDIASAIYVVVAPEINNLRVGDQVYADFYSVIDEDNVANLFTFPLAAIRLISEGDLFGATAPAKTFDLSLIQTRQSGRTEKQQREQK